jgi:heme-degrading monooxygenase HmoA
VTEPAKGGSDFVSEFQALAARMLAIAESMPGFISYKSFSSPDEERASIIEFESLEYLDAWRNHPEHTQAQHLGRERFYAEYSLAVCSPIRSTSFKHGQEHEL